MAARTTCAVLGHAKQPLSVAPVIPPSKRHHSTGVASLPLCATCSRAGALRRWRVALCHAVHLLAHAQEQVGSASARVG